MSLRRIATEIRKYLGLNDKKAVFHNVWNVAKRILRGKLRVSMLISRKKKG